MKVLKSLIFHDSADEQGASLETKQRIQFSEYLFTEHQLNVGSALHAWDTCEQISQRCLGL